MIEKLNKIFSFTVDKLQFEPPLRKETEAHSEMVIVVFGLISIQSLIT